MHCNNTGTPSSYNQIITPMHDICKPFDRLGNAELLANGTNSSKSIVQLTLRLAQSNNSLCTDDVI
jgi:hypothetical protein